MCLKVLTLSASITLDLAPISRFGAVLAEVADFVTVAARRVRRILWLLAFLGHVSLLTAEGKHFTTKESYDPYPQLRHARLPPPCGQSFAK